VAPCLCLLHAQKVLISSGSKLASLLLLVPTIVTLSFSTPTPYSFRCSRPPFADASHSTQLPPHSRPSHCTAALPLEDGSCDRNWTSKKQTLHTLQAALQRLSVHTQQGCTSITNCILATRQAWSVTIRTPPILLHKVISSNLLLMSVDIRQACTSLRYPSRVETVSRSQLSKVHTGDTTRPAET
jgi:hypothetical protein